MGLERYLNREKFGEGGFALAYKAQDAKTGLDVIIKAMKPNHKCKKSNKRRIKAFINEAKVLKSLDHPAFPKYVEHFTQENGKDGREHYFLVMEFVEGQSICSKIKGGYRFSELGVVDFTEKMADALEYLHNKKGMFGLRKPIIHNDLNYNNILMDDSGNVKIIDFGCARGGESINLNNKVIFGSNGFIAPERALGRNFVQSDFYSLGALMHSMLSGFWPDEKTTKVIGEGVTQELDKKHIVVCNEYEVHEHYDEQINKSFRDYDIVASKPILRLVKRLTDPLPDNRLSNVQEIRNYLNQCRKVFEECACSVNEYKRFFLDVRSK